MKFTERENGADEVQDLWSEASAGDDQNDRPFLKNGQCAAGKCDFFNSAYKFFIKLCKVLVINHLNFYIPE
ncbi:hypothetical protein GCM10010967_35660 [Dyadobacter beijingensis]|uniref:Uncharacterized protein n=1 Tax=Dyadobacter beijingensis TaxID=365489 RepID=A0ABQ2I6K2_9BACT|nr:hypothetical protein GCM10010967_35660 [Dyadobacter beijingensis]